MDWRERAAASPYRTAVSIQEELRAGHFDEAAAGVQELAEALARSDRRALKSQLVRLMAHVIKWLSQPDHRSRSWAVSIRGARADIRDIQEETPSLGDAAVRQMWTDCLDLARAQAEADMNREAVVAAPSWEDVFTREYRV